MVRSVASGSSFETRRFATLLRMRLWCGQRHPARASGGLSARLRQPRNDFLIRLIMVASTPLTRWASLRNAFRARQGRHRRLRDEPFSLEHRVGGANSARGIRDARLAVSLARDRRCDIALPDAAATRLSDARREHLFVRASRPGVGRDGAVSGRRVQVGNPLEASQWSGSIEGAQAKSRHAELGGDASTIMAQAPWTWRLELRTAQLLRARTQGDAIAEDGDFPGRGSADALLRRTCADG